ncbi:hypothetical protein [Lentzea cavernae]|uniref:Uncharacterized protein n=1 Tax=Lentzea cavernae TaxID=2020703 RepID=A0ABQ3MU32_9PSEU|nr:hypothetical protein [Lentzea cavernae]GHH57412.1 hypothetical protein GCM10017774_76860 [Lentzea cavernae]
MTAPRLRRPTGKGGWQRALLTGDESGIVDAAWAAAAFTADDRLVTTYWLELNPGETGDVFGAAPNADFEILDHDGTWADIIDQVNAAWEVAHDVASSGPYPSALIVHGMSGEWMMLSDLADRRARRRTAAELIRRGEDPAPAYSSDIKVEVDPDVWTLVGRRHRELMDKIKSWPGPVILIAREKRHADGRWILKAQDQLGFDVTAWVRFARGEKPEIVSFLTPERARLNSRQRRELRSKFTLSRMLWDWSGCTVDTPVPVGRTLNADQPMPGEEPPVRAVAERRPVAPRPLPPPPPSRPAPTPPEGGTSESQGARVYRLAERWLALDQRDQVPTLWAEMAREGDEIIATDVSGLLTPEERELFEVAEHQALPLQALADSIARHVLHTGTAIRSLLAVGVAS